jgi:hypothetical protein
VVAAEWALPIVLPLAHGRSPTSLRRPRVPTPSRFLPGPRGDGRRLLSLLGWLHLIREGHRLLGGESPVIASTIVGVVVGSPSRSSPGALSGKIEWRGLALSRLQAHHSALHASLIVGALWGSAPAAVVDQSGAPSAEPLSQRSFSVSSLRQWSAPGCTTAPVEACSSSCSTTPPPTPDSLPRTPWRSWSNRY